MISGLEQAIEEVRETAKGSDKERLNRIELSLQQIKIRLRRLEEHQTRGDAE